MNANTPVTKVRLLMKNNRKYSNRIILLEVLSLIAAGGFLLAQSNADKEAAVDPRAGRNFIPTPMYSETDDARILALFDGLRVADVSDGMDAAGWQNIGLMDADAKKILKDDKAGRKRLYEKLGLPADDSVK